MQFAFLVPCLGRSGRVLELWTTEVSIMCLCGHDEWCEDCRPKGGLQKSIDRIIAAAKGNGEMHELKKAIEELLDAWDKAPEGARLDDVEHEILTLSVVYRGIKDRL